MTRKWTVVIRKSPRPLDLAETAGGSQKPRTQRRWNRGVSQAVILFYNTRPYLNATRGRTLDCSQPNR